MSEPIKISENAYKARIDMLEAELLLAQSEAAVMRHRLSMIRGEIREADWLNMVRNKPIIDQWFDRNFKVKE